jgi:hypothetical protein
MFEMMSIVLSSCSSSRRLGPFRNRKFFVLFLYTYRNISLIFQKKSMRLLGSSLLVKFRCLLPRLWWLLEAVSLSILFFWYKSSIIFEIYKWFVMIKLIFTVLLHSLSHTHTLSCFLVIHSLLPRQTRRVLSSFFLSFVNASQVVWIGLIFCCCCSVLAVVWNKRSQVVDLDGVLWFLFLFIQSMDQFCPNCGSDSIIDDIQMGSIICSSCGHVLTESAVQSEVEQQVAHGSECRKHLFNLLLMNFLSLEISFV